VAQARGESESRLALARATEAEKRAQAADVTPNTVMMHAYDALGNLGGNGTTFLLGDWSKLPKWLFPKMPGFQTAFPTLVPVGPAAPSPGAASAQGGTTLGNTTGNPYATR